ncbi:thioredoxin domain-containing protein [Novosphingobium sp.]|uniref:thioredoxin domain-containing protein n=1 Tax=Novosphingobium sp. TaxID=1874826 RepID=UPI0035ADBFD6
MTAPMLRRFAFAAALAPLALGLAACSKSEDGGSAALSGAPIAKVAPPAGKSWAEVTTVTPEGGYQIGNPDAPIKVLEFGALSCSHCAEFSEAASAELRDNFVSTGRVSYELRLVMNNALDIPAALLATCGAPEAVVPLADQFWAWQTTMFDNLKNAGDAKMQGLSALPDAQRPAALAQLAGMDQFFAARGVAADQGKACLTNQAKTEGLVKASDGWLKSYDVQGTPTFFVNGKKADYNTWQPMKAELERLGAR